MKKAIMMIILTAILLVASSTYAATILYEEFEGTSNGILHGATYADTGYTGQGMLFDETSDYVTFSGSYFPTMGTFETYIYLTGPTPSYSANTIFDTNGASGYHAKHLSFSLVGNGDILHAFAWGPSVGSPEARLDSNTHLEFNQWYAIGLSWGSEGLGIYIDGVLDAFMDYTRDRSLETVYLGDSPEDSWAGTNYRNSFFGILDGVRTSDIQNDITYSNLNPVPEPATMLLLGTGLIGLAGARRKYRK